MPSAEHVVDGIPDLTAVIPAGGSGTRLWPLSRAGSPKFLHDLTGSGRTLLQATVDRLRPLVGDRVMVVTGRRHADAVRAQVPELRDLLVEPSARDSMPAIGLAAAVLERRDPQAVLASFAADHVIGDLDVFHDRVGQAVRAAREGWLVTLGISPTHPATGFGYIRVGPRLQTADSPDSHHVRAFVEKPDAERARTYLESGDYLWNAGMFVVRATVLLELLDQQHPRMVEVLREIAAAPARLEELWGTLTAVAIDHAVAEPAAAAGRVAVVKAPFDWDDVGDFASLADLLEDSADDQGLRVLGDPDKVVNVGSTGVVVARSGRTVVTLGLDDVVVVDTADALLVTTRERAQEVRNVVALLHGTGREELT
ncbi:mannose-1-phosphate guanylyltransferase [Ornithinimicrobium tianjinense]|uniref:Mannose-1-phosphate guanyltransferase n=1 Tax=Ornithinimicrobium tianjinense TaxID=1195761 RepID=A0A917BND3_9MICO|nr:mannose-1-phosphate guanylyltransferase [Ornithinimicrobium tianjinense]GGF51503.1 mannose-1-phosphate guanyltransferase [Ornithinimicrobium tianjinense]